MANIDPGYNRYAISLDTNHSITPIHLHVSGEVISFWDISEVSMFHFVVLRVGSVNAPPWVMRFRDLMKFRKFTDLYIYFPIQNDASGVPVTIGLMIGDTQCFDAKSGVVGSIRDLPITGSGPNGGSSGLSTGSWRQVQATTPAVGEGINHTFTERLVIYGITARLVTGAGAGTRSLQLRLLSSTGQVKQSYVENNSDNAASVNKYIVWGPSFDAIQSALLATFTWPTAPNSGSIVSTLAPSSNMVDFPWIAEIGDVLQSVVPLALDQYSDIFLKVGPG